ncbi:hypothetical protein NEOLEDRAFT_661863 [Neolentinus lepideus HHB14362 ss-1]|uniref:DNA/RNA polymerase n=1 Tax=Neolentinus lepideus HHB14362 ss-1 TaxID=1314782 RepID=A0A165QH04_9AGAM|nr:hypothetical protein NEOLEDRAFT_661863 [Neolentinus lepideus HHB14362 ss-1]
MVRVKDRLSHTATQSPSSVTKSSRITVPALLQRLMPSYSCNQSSQEVTIPRINLSLPFSLTSECSTVQIGSAQRQPSEADTPPVETSLRSTKPVKRTLLDRIEMAVSGRDRLPSPKLRRTTRRRRSGQSISQNCRGSSTSSFTPSNCPFPCASRETPSSCGLEIPNSTKPHLLTRLAAPSSRTANGQTSSRANLSTSTPCSPVTTPPHSIIAGPRSSVSLSSRLGKRGHQSMLSQPVTGSSPGPRLPKPFDLRSRTEKESCVNTEAISPNSLEPCTHHDTISATSQTSISSTLIAPGLSPLMKTRGLKRGRAEEGRVESAQARALKRAADGMTAGAPSTLRAVATPMSARPAALASTPRDNAREEHAPTSFVSFEPTIPPPKKPRYTRDFLWETHEVSCTPSATASETAPPVPDVPEHERGNLTALRTIALHPELFKVVTPINVDRFEELLCTHPNQPLVKSVCKGLREGFWPYADTSGETRPETWDGSSERELRDPAHLAFVKEQRDQEVRLGRFSEAFGPDLLPGMSSTPIWVVPKPRSDKLRLVVDHSAGEHALNAMISKEDAHIRLDNIHDLGKCLRRARQEHGDAPLVMFKSDASQAYRRLPMHPLWQIRQVITVGDDRHVDRCNNFGNRAGGKLWCTFMSLVLWIAINVKMILDLLGYVDDSFSWEFLGRVLFYPPYGQYYPTKQALLLRLWDEIGLPHEKPKQEYGPNLTIIGFDVDPALMRVTMPSKTHPNAPIHLNKVVVSDLSWVADHLEKSDGIRMLTALAWDRHEADLHLLTDAATSAGLAFWAPARSEGFQAHRPPDAPVDSIFYFEALAVLSAIEYAAKLQPCPGRLVIFSDSSNTVDMFNTLRAITPYNEILQCAVDILLDTGIDLRVQHIPGEKNVVADALSRFNNQAALSVCPSLQISMFQPPRWPLGAVQK